MNPDEFESRLQRQPLRQPPAEWRKPILDTARDAAETEGVCSRRRESLEATAHELTFMATWKRRLRELFWPHPVAWGVMAAIWVAIGGVHLFLREPATGAAPLRMAAWSGLPTMLAMQEEILAALNEQPEPPPPTPSQPVPPQSCIEPRRESYDV